MKSNRLLSRSLIAGLLITAFCSFSTFAGINDGLMAFYPFDGDANDISANGNVGTIHGGVVFVKGINGSAAQFNGVDGYIEIPSSASLKPLNCFSVNLWLRVQSFTKQWSPIFIKGGPKITSEAQRSYALWLQNTAPFLHLASAGDGAGQIDHYAGIVDTGTWINYTGIIDRENHVTTVYINGALVYRGADAYSSFNDNNNSLRFGWTQETHSTYSPFCGKIDEVRFYNRNLSEEEIKALYLNGTENQNITLNTININASGDNVVSKDAGVQDCNGKLYISQFTDFRGWLGSRKVWISFDISTLKNNGQLLDNASLLLTRATWGNYSSSFIDVDVYGLLDCSEDSWNECAIDWWNAPGNNTSSRGADEIKTVLLGKLMYVNDAAGIGNQYAIYGKDLVNFLNSDQNDNITIILAFNHSSPAVWTAYESSESGVPNYSMPRLLVNTFADNKPCLSISSSNIFTIEQNTSITKEVILTNTSTSVQPCTLQVLNPFDDIIVNINGSQFLSLNPGETYNIPVEINTASPATGIYNVMIKAQSSICEQVYSDIFLKVLPPATPPLPDLSITTSDINLIDYTIGDSATFELKVANGGTASATAVPIAIYNWDTKILDLVVDEIPADNIKTIFIKTPLNNTDGRYTRVVLDPQNEIQESGVGKDNNEASRYDNFGNPNNMKGGLLILGNSSSETYTNALFQISGKVVYDIALNGQRYTDYPAKGAKYKVTVTGGGANGQDYGYRYTNTTGDFVQHMIAPSEPGIYSATVYATDETFSTTQTFSFEVKDANGPNSGTYRIPIIWGEWVWPEPCPECLNAFRAFWEWLYSGSVTRVVQDVYIYSENIFFSNTKPKPYQLVNIAAEFQYYTNNDDAENHNVPLLLKATLPGSGTKSIITGTMLTGAKHTLFGTWIPQQEGIYIIEAEASSSAGDFHDANPSNNAGTRGIIVGVMAFNTGAQTGKVSGPNGTGVPNIPIKIRISSGGDYSSTYTDSQGYYSFANVPVGKYEVICIVPTGYIAEYALQEVEIKDQMATSTDFRLNIPISCIKDLSARSKNDIVQLTWTHDGSAIYKIFRSETGHSHDFVQIGTTASTYSTYEDKGLTIGKEYWYKVLNDSSCESNIVYIKTSGRIIRR